MNPQQYPPQPGQTPQGYPPQGPPAGPQGVPQGPYPPQPGYGQPQPGQVYQQPGPPPGAMPNAAPGGAPDSPMAGYNPYPYPGEYEAASRKKGNGKLILGVFAVLLIVGVIIAVLAMGGNGNTGNTNQPTTQNQNTETTTSTAGADVVPRSDGTLDLSKRITSSKTLKAQVVKAKSKEQVNLSSGFSFMVNQVEDYTSPNPTTKAAENKKFVVATVVVGNRNQTGNISVSYLDFRLRDESNQLVAGHITTNEILGNILASPSEIKPGAQINGKIVFEVDKIDKAWVLKHGETYQKTTDNTTFTVEGEISVDLAVPETTTSPTPSAGTTTPTTPTPTPSTTPTTN